jgi:parvulin-like peptidyl-prolyl isomerase
MDSEVNKEDSTPAEPLPSPVPAATGETGGGAAAGAPLKAPSSAPPEDQSPERPSQTGGPGSTVGQQSSTSGWNPLIVVGALLVLIVASLILINHFQAKKSPAAVSTTAPLATPTPAGTPVIKGGSVAAVVNGQKIPTSKYRVLLNLTVKQRASAPGASVKTLASQALNTTIDYELVRQYAQAHHVAVTPKDIQKETAAIEATQGGAKRFPAFLKSLGLTTSSYDYLVTSQILEQKVASKVAHGTLLAFAHVRHILIAPAATAKGKSANAAALAKANKIAQELRSGGSWALLAKKNSVDTQSGPHGGDLGDLYQGTMVPAFNRAIFSAPIGTITVVHSQFGYHVVEVLARGKKIPPATSTAGRAQRSKEFASWLRKQMKSSKISKLVTVG